MKIYFLKSTVLMALLCVKTDRMMLLEFCIKSIFWRHFFIWVLTSAALEVEGTEAESTAPRSSTDMLVDASVLFESLGLDSTNCFREGCLLPLPDANTCPLIFLQSVPIKFSCKNEKANFTVVWVLWTMKYIIQK